jgi:hypothetical protein
VELKSIFTGLCQLVVFKGEAAMAQLTHVFNQVESGTINVAGQRLGAAACDISVWADRGGRRYAQGTLRAEQGVLLRAGRTDETLTFESASAALTIRITAVDRTCAYFDVVTAAPRA